MRAVQIRHFGGPEVLEVNDIPMPVPGAGEVRIEVDAAAINPIDRWLRSGQFASYVKEPILLGFGWDVCGAIDAIGTDVAGWVAGDRVIALLNRFLVPCGTHASHVIVPATSVAVAPSSVDAVAAATLSLNSMTADQAIDLLDLPAQSWLVVTGAAGGVGEYAVRLAARRGLRVIAVAAQRDSSMFATTGGEILFLERTSDLANAVREVVPGGATGLIDAAQIGARALAAVHDGGRFACVSAPSAPAAERDVSVLTFGVRPDGARLAELSQAVDDGWLHTRVERTFSLEQAADAHRLLEVGGLRGRIVLVP